jgi:hypothetical protein
MAQCVHLVADAASGELAMDKTVPYKDKSNAIDVVAIGSGIHQDEAKLSATSQSDSFLSRPT